MTVEPTVPLVGRDKAVEGEIAVSQQQGRPVSPLHCARTGKGSSYQESKDQLRGAVDQKKGESMPSRGSTYREERRTCCNNDAHLSHQLVPSLSWPRVTVGGGPPSPFFPSTGKAPLSFGSRGNYGSTALSGQGHGMYSTVE